MTGPLPGYDDGPERCDDCGRIIGAARGGCRCGVIDEPGYDEDRWLAEVWDR